MPNLDNDTVLDDDMPKRRTLKETLAVIKNKEAERNDVVVELKAIEHTRLEKLADQLKPFMEEIDDTDDRFDFALTKGNKPRLWIDMSAFVVMGQNKQSYRLMKDTRMGRLILAETDDCDKAADIVSEYVAEKVLERERFLEGEWVSYKDSNAIEHAAKEKAQQEQKIVSKRSYGFLWFLLGVLTTLCVLLAAAYYFVPDAFQL